MVLFNIFHSVASGTVGDAEDSIVNKRTQILAFVWLMVNWERPTINTHIIIKCP